MSGISIFMVKSYNTGNSHRQWIGASLNSFLELFRFEEKYKRFTGRKINKF
jgi:hypothetical protein